MVLGIVEEMLEHLGWSVITKEEGGDTIREYEQALKSEDPFGLVILDLNVPRGWGGEITAKKIRSRNYSGPLQPGLTGRPGHSRALWSVGVLECWSLNIGHHYSALRLSGIELRNKRIAMEQTGQGIHGTNSIFAGR